MTDEAPAWAYEKARISPPDAAWAEVAEKEREVLVRVLTPWLGDGGVQHVGSTSVPGLPAKPIVDLAAAVTDLDETVRGAAAELDAEGWCYVPPELDQRPWRRFYVKPDATGQHRVAHLHLITEGHERWHDQIHFRDVLRGDAEVAARYAELKRGLADDLGNDREAYTEGKAAFVASVLKDHPRP